MVLQSKAVQNLASKPMTNGNDDVMYGSSYSGAMFGESYVSDNVMHEKRQIGSSG